MATTACCRAAGKRLYAKKPCPAPLRPQPKVKPNKHKVWREFGNAEKRAFLATAAQKGSYLTDTRSAAGALARESLSLFIAFLHRTSLTFLQAGQKLPLKFGSQPAFVAQALNSIDQDPLFRRIRAHAQKRLPLDAPGALPLARYKEYLRLERIMLERYQRKGDSGLRVARSYAIIMDVLVETIFAHAVKAYEAANGKLPCEVALLALGGYGRAELSPHSDIDLMFLYPKGVDPKKLKPLQQAMSDGVLYPLWDLGLKVGHSSRTIKEAIEEAKGDQQTLNALLEARYICGDKKLFLDFDKLYRRYYRRENPREYVQERLRDQQERRAKFGGSVFLQEPDIKNGVGGLRDYQNILWMAQVRLGEGNLQALVDNQFLTPSEAKQLERAYDFMMRVRNELHFGSKRPTDTLSLEAQPRIAWNLGYRQENLFERVEVFMRDYYQSAHLIYTSSKILEQRLALQQLGQRRLSFRAVLESRRRDEQRIIDGFILSRDKISYEHRGIFNEDPLRLIRLFRYMQQYRVEPELELLVLVRGSINLLTPNVIADEGANSAFRSILQTRGHVYPILSQMHETGVLGRFIPEFGRLTCLVQHEYYHRYTADIHSLHGLHELDRVFADLPPNGETMHAALLETTTPALLYLILLLHDLGKAENAEKLPQRCAELADPVIRRLGVGDKNRLIILKIISLHLEMARFWQHYDVDDPRTSESFAKLVGDEDNLRYLYVFTYCDARATAQGLWNSYKQSLHEQLFNATLEYLRQDTETPARRLTERKEMIYQKLQSARLGDVPPEQVEAHFNLLPERYFIHNSTQDVELHLRMIHELLGSISQAESVGALVPVIDWKDDTDQGISVINIVTWDRAGLFAKIAGAFTIAGVNILSAKAISRADHVMIDTFYVTDPDGGSVRNAKAREIFTHHLHEALLRNKDLMPIIREHAKRNTSSFQIGAQARLRAPIPPLVDIYHEMSLKRTIVEVQATDRVGLLYQLAYAIFQHNFDITFARISTERGAALDTFYIEPIDGTKPAGSTSNLVSLREAIHAVIADDKEG